MFVCLINRFFKSRLFAVRRFNNPSYLYGKNGFARSYKMFFFPLSVRNGFVFFDRMKNIVKTKNCKVVVLSIL